MNLLPETILQFGAGSFLRGFVDLFVHHANAAGQDVGRIVVVQSTGTDRADLLNSRNCAYHVAIRGTEHGQLVDRVEQCNSISRALTAQNDWQKVLQLAESPDLKYVVSNTTEAGFEPFDDDHIDAVPPRSFPAKLLAVLHARWRSGGVPLVIMPCELIEANAAVLLSCIVRLAERLNLPDAFQSWLTTDCIWLSSLVDRIVPGRPARHPLSGEDPLLIMAEPYALWALESATVGETWFDHPSIVRTTDVKPYFLRKVRILNGLHTALLSHVGLARFTYVRECVSDQTVNKWMKRLLFEEIVPVVNDRCEGVSSFAQQVLERFANPFLDHRLTDIALHHDVKKSIRLEPTRREYFDKFGTMPPLLSEALRNDKIAKGS